MRSGTWDGATSTDNVRVTVNGVERPVKSVKIFKGMRDGHPAAAGDGSWCVESTITWQSPLDVEAGAPEPFSGTSWAPSPGDSVVVSTGDGATGQWFVQHRGVIDSTSGSIGEGSAVSQTVDAIDDLAGLVSFGALLARMPPATEGQPYREMGLASTFLVDRCLRRVQGDAFGWYATPPRTWQTLGSVPAQGSLWPEVGTLMSCGHRSTPNAGPSWVKTPYGVAPTNFLAETRLIGSTSEPILSCAVTGGGSAPAGLAVVDDAGVGFELSYDPTDDRVRVSTRGVSPSSSYSLPREGVRRAAMYARPVSGGQEITLRLADGRQQTYAPTAATFPGGWAATRVLADSNTSTLGWWIVEGTKVAAQRWDTLAHVPTARLRIGTHQWWRASTDMVSTNVATWLADQVDAECAAMWLDEDGVMQWAGRGVLEEQAPATTYSSSLDVDEVKWITRRRTRAKSVMLTYEDPRIELGYLGATSRTLWMSDSIDAGPGQTETTIVTVPEDQDWIGVDTSPHHIKDYNQPWTYYTNGSSYGGTQYRASDDGDQAWAQFVACTMTREFSAREFTIDFTPWPSITAGHRVKSSYPANSGAFMRAGGGVVALRAKARTIWVKRERSTGAGATGPAQLTHDVGRRVQAVGSGGSGSDGIQDLLDYLAGVASAPAHGLDGLVVAHDPRTQIGDTITIRDEDITGRWVDLIVEQQEHDSVSFTDRITGRITDYGEITGLSLHTPAAHTALTPPTTWTKKEA